MSLAETHGRERVRLVINVTRPLGKKLWPSRTPGAGAKPAANGAGAETIRVRYRRHPLWILAESKYERNWRAKPRQKEPWTVDWLEDEVRAGDAIYDLGANVGVFSLIGAKLLGGEGLVVAFEPGFSSYARLCDNIRLNGLDDLVVPVPIALSSSTGLQGLTYRSQAPGQSRHLFSPEPWKSHANGSRKRYTQPIVSITLDEAISLFSLPAANLVKLDVDGAEPHVLRGARQTLTRPDCRSILVEIDDTLADEVVPLIESYGFTLKDLHRRKETSKVEYGIFHRVA